MASCSCVYVYIYRERERERGMLKIFIKSSKDLGMEMCEKVKTS